MDVWDSLTYGVISAASVFSVEMRLDKYRKNKDILYDYEFQLEFKGITRKFSRRGVCFIGIHMCESSTKIKSM